MWRSPGRQQDQSTCRKCFTVGWILLSKSLWYLQIIIRIRGQFNTRLNIWFLLHLLLDKRLLQRHVLTHYHNLHDFLGGVWHIQELPAMSEPGARGWMWSKYQTRGLPVRIGSGCGSGTGCSITNALKTAELCTYDIEFKGSKCNI